MAACRLHTGEDMETGLRIWRKMSSFQIIGQSLLAVWLASCGSSHGNVGQPGTGGTAGGAGASESGGTTGVAGTGGDANTSSAAGMGGAGTTGAAGTGGVGQGGVSGSPGAGGAGGFCPSAPATNDPGCHPTDQNVVFLSSPVTANCAPGLTCVLVTRTNLVSCDGNPFRTFVCCELPGAQTAFCLGSTTDDCPRPIAGQDPACTLPLASPCSDGLTCSYGSGSGGTSYNARCCGGTWVSGSVCPADAGVD